MGNAVSEAASLLVQKETTFAAAATNAMIAIPFESFKPVSKTVPIKRPAVRKRAGQSYHGTGGLDISAALRPAPEPDALFPLLAWGMGAQTTPGAATYATSALTSSTTAGAGTVIPVTAGTGTKFLVSDNVTLGFGTANIEVCAVTANAANTVTCTTTKTHASGDLVQGLSPLGYSSTLSFSLSSLPSFTAQLNRVNDAIDYLGCKVDSMKFSIAPNGELMCDLSIVAANEQIDASPVNPAFGSLKPLISEATAGSVLLNGVALTGSSTLVRKFDLTVNNSLQKDFRTAASRAVGDFPLGQRIGSCTLELSWPDNTKYALFLGAVGATAPQGTIAGVSLTYNVASESLVDPTRALNYSISFIMPSLFPLSDPVNIGLSGAITQTFTCDLTETPGNNDDLKIAIVSAAVTAY